jgi:hypothetical protein
MAKSSKAEYIFLDSLLGLSFSLKLTAKELVSETELRKVEAWISYVDKALTDDVLSSVLDCANRLQRKINLQVNSTTALEVRPIKTGMRNSEVARLTRKLRALRKASKKGEAFAIPVTDEQLPAPKPPQEEKSKSPDMRPAGDWETEKIIGRIQSAIAEGVCSLDFKEVAAFLGILQKPGGLRVADKYFKRSTGWRTDYKRQAMQKRLDAFVRSELKAAKK